MFDLNKKIQIFIGCLAILVTIISRIIFSNLLMASNLSSLYAFNLYVIIILCFYFIPILLRKNKKEKYFILGIMVMASIMMGFVMVK